LDVGPILRFGSQLRLLDAFGIRGQVALQRQGIKDYVADTKGFTRWLFDEGPDGPTVVSSVHEHKFWSGINTTIFYGDALRELIDLEEDKTAKGKPMELARHYVIKIVGVPLFFNGQRIGVMKVELPNTFDDGRHYDQADQQFLVEAATAAGDVLGEFKSFLEGEWFQVPENVHAIINVTRMAAELLRTRLVSPQEAQTLWENLRDFVNRNAEDVQEEMRETISRLTPQEKEVLKQTRSWADTFTGSASDLARNLVTEVAAKVLVELSRGH
jgi:hypothetical protein